MTVAGPAEPSPRAAAWLARGVLDLEFYAALRGEVFSSRQVAAEDFVRHGMRLQLTRTPTSTSSASPGRYDEPGARAVRATSWRCSTAGTVSCR